MDSCLIGLALLCFVVWLANRFFKPSTDQPPIQHVEPPIDDSAFWPYGPMTFDQWAHGLGAHDIGSDFGNDYGTIDPFDEPDVFDDL